MILTYHKVAATSQTPWYVSADTFDRQLAALRAYEVVNLDEYDPGEPRHAVITFDGVYECIVDFALPLLRKWGYCFELFVIGDHIGLFNEFDQHTEPPAAFAGLESLERLRDGGGRVQWHTRSHQRLEGCDAETLARELTVPDALRDRFPEPDQFRWLAFPHGVLGAEEMGLVQARFAGAVTSAAGDATQRHALPTRLVHEETDLATSRVSVVVPNYDYGVYLPEAVESVMGQSLPADEVLLADDASTDCSTEVIPMLGRRYPELRVRVNERNLGIVENFRHAVADTKGDYVCLVGADNRMQHAYIEHCKSVLDAHPEVGVVYTDMAIFGPLSHVLAAKVGAEATAVDDVYRWRFPEPTEELILAVEERNFMHGSSMFRREAYDAVGGYQQSESAEDHGLFARILHAGWRPWHVAIPLIEYRQHSRDQANTRLEDRIRLDLQRAVARRLEARLAQEVERASRLQVALDERHERFTHVKNEYEFYLARSLALQQQLEEERRHRLDLEEELRRALREVRLLRDEKPARDD